MGEKLKPIEKLQDIWHIAATVEELAVFTQPFTTPTEEQILLDQFRIETARKYGIGLVVGRFQPLHYGHLYLMKQALQVADFIIVGIGSSNVRNKDNPFSVEQRERMLYKAFEREQDVKRRILQIVRLPDYLDDDLWLGETLRRTGEVDVVVGNNDWVNGIFGRAIFPVITTPLFQRSQYEGRKIREQLRNAH